MFGPLCGTFAKPIVATSHRMKHVNRAIPGSSPVPFHVAVKAKQFAIGVEGNIVRVALSGRKQFDILAVQIHSSDITTGRLRTCAKTVPIFHSRQRHVIAVISMRRTFRKISRNTGKVSTHRIQHVVRTERESVRTVFARSTMPGAKKFYVVITIVTIGVPASIQCKSLFPFATDVEHFLNKQHSHCFTYWNAQDFLFGNLSVFERDPRNWLTTLAAEQ